MRFPTPTVCALLSSAMLLASACADDGPGGFYGVDMTPRTLVPGASAGFTVALQANGQPDLGATIQGSLTSDSGATVDLGALTDNGDGTYTAAEVTAEEGTWKATFNINGSLGSTVAQFDVSVSCSHVGDGSPGAACCGPADCGSGVCAPGAVCLAATCDDSVVNGAEADVDCGGDCSLCETGSACADGSDCLTGNCLDSMCAPRIPALGEGSLDNVTLTAIAVGPDGLSAPRDLEFEPGTDHLWVVNNATDSVTIVFNASTDDRLIQNYWGFGAQHFCASPSAIAFGQPGTMATIHDTDLPTQGPNGTPGDFMGPTLHSTDLAIFDAGTASHLDMLHNSPLGGGIAWEAGNIYWVFDGYHSSITRYDFKIDHGPAGTDHSDGVINRYVEGQVKRVPQVPSHLEMDLDTKRLYIADTGNNRIAVLDTTTGSYGSAMSPFQNYDGVSDLSFWNSDPVSTLVDGNAVGLQQPSGLVLVNDMVVISDYATGYIWAFDRDTGDLVDSLDTGLGPNTVSGLAHKNGVFYFTDTQGNRVMQLKAK